MGKSQARVGDRAARSAAAATATATVTAQSNDNVAAKPMEAAQPRRPIDAQGGKTFLEPEEAWSFGYEHKSSMQSQSAANSEFISS